MSRGYTYLASPFADRAAQWQQFPAVWSPYSAERAALPVESETLDAFGQRLISALALAISGMKLSGVLQRYRSN